MALPVLWELSLQERAETNPSVLNARLRELRASRLVDHAARIQDRPASLSAMIDMVFT